MKTAALMVLAAVALSAARVRAEEASDPAARARKSLARALNSRSNDEVRACIEALVRAGGRENIEAILRLLPGIPESEDAMYWDLVQGACSFRDREALEHLGEAIVRARGAGRSRDLVFGLARNTSKSAVFALRPVLEKGPPDLQLMAAEKIATIPVPESVDALIALLKLEEAKPTSELRDLAIDGLQAITGQEFKNNSVNWEGWWQKNRDRPLGGPRPSREGRTGTAVDVLDRKRAREFAGLERAPKKAVIVLSAEYPERDLNNGNIERALESMGIPHEVVKRPDFEKYDLRGVGAILINCAQFHEFCICPTCKPGGTKENRLYQCTGCDKHKKFSAKLSAAAIKRLQAFVRRGGFLFCEDWTVKEVLERSFPQYVAAGKVLRKSKVDVVPARGRASHPYLKGIFRPERPPDLGADGPDDGEPPGGGEGGGGGAGGPGGESGKTTPRKPDPPDTKGKPGKPELVQVKHRWVVDDESWAFKLLDPSKVSILLTSGKLQKDAEGEGVVAFCFRPGAEGEGSDVTSRRKGPGMVMQVLSHFGKQDSAEDEYTLQNLLVNFLIAANVARHQDELPEKKGGKAGKGEDGEEKE